MAKANPKSKTTEELLAEEFASDPNFQTEWERLEFARLVAARVIRYRAENGLSQRDLAKRLGVHQPQVTRLENAKHHPDNETLAKLARLGFVFAIQIAPAGAKKRQTSKLRNQVSAVIHNQEATTEYTIVRTF